jgi:AcrR family transcriptional regulator
MTEPALEPGSAAWWHHRYTTTVRRRPRADGLTVDKIMTAALHVLHRDGLDSLTMRGLADELGTTHTSLYRHVASRDELLVELVDHVLGEIEPDPSATQWRDRAEWQAREFRRVLLANPGVVPLVTATQLLGPNAMRAREYGVRILLDAGASAELAVHTYLLVAHFVLGSALLDTSAASRTRARRTAMARVFKVLSPDEYPVVTAHADVISAPDGDAEFEFGLATILDGVAARLALEHSRGRRERATTTRRPSSSTGAAPRPATDR